MALHADVLEPYSAREPRLAVVLTAGIVFLENLLVSYQSFLREVLQHTLTLSTVEWAVFIFGPLLVEPVLLFGALYYASTRSGRAPPLLAVIPGLAGAVLVGSYLGQTAGGELWVLRHGFVRFAGIDLFGAISGLDVQLLLYARDAAEPMARDVLTAVAALGLARARGTEPGPTEDERSAASGPGN